METEVSDMKKRYILVFILVITLFGVLSTCEKREDPLINKALISFKENGFSNLYYYYSSIPLGEMEEADSLSLEEVLTSSFFDFDEEAIALIKNDYNLLIDELVASVDLSQLENIDRYDLVFEDHIYSLKNAEYRIFFETDQRIVVQDLQSKDLAVEYYQTNTDCTKIIADWQKHMNELIMKYYKYS